MKSFIPVLFVRDVSASAEYLRTTLGFAVDFLHGTPPFYGAVSRDQVCLHLRFVRRPNFADLAASENSLILGGIEVPDVWPLFDEFSDRGALIAQAPTKQPWGGTDFHVRDLDGNVISFVSYEQGELR
ncbi:Phleomycin resistance protein [Mycolicibacterium phlei]|uniref:VOC family protein n=1 Tax=Mycobacteroides chelonae TaxID=1774 RepID=UPI000697D96E|nr:VOC family protein [Mycobacteroides chelonae]VEG18129.1 Phleomycin resistance protein [Mycolicibacterium phlei]